MESELSNLKNCDSNSLIAETFDLTQQRQAMRGVDQRKLYREKFQMGNALKYDVNRNFFDQTTPKFSGVASRRMKEHLQQSMPKSYKDISGHETANMTDLSLELRQLLATISGALEKLSQVQHLVQVLKAECTQQLSEY